ncbi:MAG TPA: metallophosphoesterase [Methanosarcinaceae archaeon]|nr:metallophosphoesterase [Methanosarcinaceae archaeon]
MSIEITPIINEPALVVSSTTKTLVIADIHLGSEWDLYKSGFSIPSRMDQHIRRIHKYIEQTTPDRIILLGDIKHNIPRISWQERDEIPCFLESIAQHAPIDIFPGNHDGNIDFLLPGGVDITLHSPRGAVLDGVGYFHGHTWPDPQLLGAKYIITAHNHPIIRFTDSLGYATVEPVWIRTGLKCDVFAQHFRSIDFSRAGMWGDPKIFIMPAFNELCGGVAFNESLHDDLLGPVFSSEGFDLDNAKAYLLDGTNLGILKNLRRMEESKQRVSRKRGKGKERKRVKKGNERVVKE